MSGKLVLVLVCSLFVQLNYAQKATISEKKVVMKTYMFSDPNPVPEMEKNYPYFNFDGYTNKSTLQEWNMVILENDFIKVFVNTDIGGKIWGAIEKSTGEEFLYYNDVVKFRDIAYRGPWTSGGLEFNFGIMSHTPTCSTPQDYVIKENEDGSVSCVIGAIDLHTRTKWNVEINLQKDKAYVETKSSFFNTGNLPVPFYHYSNAAAKTEGNLEFIFPGSHYVGHSEKVGNWPNNNGRAISFYDNNNFEGYKSYHVINGYADFVGGYYHDDDFGFGNIHSYDKMPGKKLWIWGLADEGMIWEDLLTDTDGQYIEFQTGNMFNQAMGGLTPFKHLEFIPYDSNLSTELYFPLKKTGGMVAATENGVLNVVRKNDATIEIILSALALLQTELLVKSEGQVLSKIEVSLEPLELSIIEVALNIGEDFSVELGEDLLYYSSKKENVIVNRPVTANKDFNWDSAVGLFTKGLEFEKQFSYIRGGHPRKKAQDLYLKSLELDPAYAPALNRVAFNYYRMMQYDQALFYTIKSLAIDTYDPEANYLFGIINAKLGNKTDAKSGFSIASISTSYRSAAFTGLAKIFLVEARYDKAIARAKEALVYNQNNVVALEIQAVALRLQNKFESARKVLAKLYGLDNTSAFVVKENMIISDNVKSNNLSVLITNELQIESYISLALKYQSFGLIDESISVLKASPKDAKVLLLLAYLDIPNRLEWLEKGINASPDFVFPFRTATYEALTELMKLDDSWKLKYYASLILWEKELVNEAKDLVIQCGNQPDNATFYMSKAKLFADDKTVIKKSLTKAKEIDPDNWRLDLALIERLMSDKDYVSAAGIAKKNYAKNKDLSIMGMKYAEALLSLGKYKKSLSFLQNFEIIPFEGAMKGRLVYHEVAIKLAFVALKKGDYKTAIKYVEKAKLWPKKLGSGKPFNVDERLENSIMAYCYKQLNDKEKEREYNSKVAVYQLDKSDKDDARLYLQVLALQNSNRESEWKTLINKVMATDGDNESFQWVKAKESKDSPVINKLTFELVQKANKNLLDNSFLLMKEFLEITKQ